MGILGKITATVVQTALLPVEVVKDIATLGGVITEKGETYTGKRLRDIDDTIQDLIDDLTD